VVVMEVLATMVSMEVLATTVLMEVLATRASMEVLAMTAVMKVLAMMVVVEVLATSTVVEVLATMAMWCTEFRAQMRITFSKLNCMNAEVSFDDDLYDEIYYGRVKKKNYPTIVFLALCMVK